MKKVFSILLLLVFLFNVGGYYIVFWGLRLQTDRQLSARLDANQYSDHETIELKIPVALPYPIHHPGEFQRVDGRFEHQGEFYKLVKQKLQYDTLYVVCILDQEMKYLVNAMTDYGQLTQTVPGTDQKSLNFLSKLLKDFYSKDPVSIVHHHGFSMVILFREASESWHSLVLPVHAPPPRA